VLSIEPEPVDALRGEVIHGHELTPHLDGGITLETVDRFKGLESDVVVLLVDEAESDAARARAYVGMSRARVLLLLAGPTSAKTSLGWPS
jgi:superfamily I DNA and RNA helicase